MTQPQVTTDNSWKKRAFIFLFCQSISIFGTSLVQFAITWYITLETNSGLYATLVIVCGFLPTFFLSPFAGVWADRYNRKKIIILADGFVAACTLGLAIAFMQGHRMIWLFLITVGLRAIGSAVQNPCVGAILPDIVPQEKLTRMNGINSSIQSLIMLASPMLSGALLSVADVEHILYIDVATAVLAMVMMTLFLHLPKKKKTTASAGGADYFGELKAGFAYIARHDFLRHMFLFSGAFMFLAAPAAFLTPLYTVRAFGSDVWRLTAVELAFAAGMMIGGVTMASWGGLKNRSHTMAVGFIGMGVFTVGLGLPVTFWVYSAFMLLCGTMLPVFNTAATVVLQEKIDPAFMGRVFGVMAMIGSSMMPMGMLVFGPLADVVPIQWMLLATGGLTAALGLLFLRCRSLIVAGKRIEGAEG